MQHRALIQMEVKKTRTAPNGNIKQVTTDIQGFISNLSTRRLMTMSVINANIKQVTKKVGRNCDTCSKEFFRNWELSKHKRVLHQKRKDFECVHCFEQFGYKS